MHGLMESIAECSVSTSYSSMCFSFLKKHAIFWGRIAGLSTENHTPLCSSPSQTCHRLHCYCCSVAQLFWHFVTPWTAAHQASLSFTMSQTLLKLLSIQPSYPWSSSFPPVFNLSHHQGLFQWVGSSHQSILPSKVLELQLQHQSFQQIFRVDFLQA